MSATKPITQLPQISAAFAQLVLNSQLPQLSTFLTQLPLLSKSHEFYSDADHKFKTQQYINQFSHSLTQDNKQESKLLFSAFSNKVQELITNNTPICEDFLLGTCISASNCIHCHDNDCCQTFVDFAISYLHLEYKRRSLYIITAINSLPDDQCLQYQSELKYHSTLSGIPITFGLQAINTNENDPTGTTSLFKPIPIGLPSIIQQDDTNQQQQQQQEIKNGSFSKPIIPKLNRHIYEWDKTWVNVPQFAQMAIDMQLPSSYHPSFPGKAKAELMKKRIIHGHLPLPQLNDTKEAYCRRMIARTASLATKQTPLCEGFMLGKCHNTDDFTCQYNHDETFQNLLVEYIQHYLKYKTRVLSILIVCSINELPQAQREQYEDDLLHYSKLGQVATAFTIDQVPIVEPFAFIKYKNPHKKAYTIGKPKQRPNFNSNNDQQDVHQGGHKKQNSNTSNNSSLLDDNLDDDGQQSFTLVGKSKKVHNGSSNQHRLKNSQQDIHQSGHKKQNPNTSNSFLLLGDDDDDADEQQQLVDEDPYS